MDVAPIDRVLERLGEGLKRSGENWVGRCPAHEDRRASLSVSVGDDGRVLLHCHAGCETADIAAKMGMDLADLFPGNGKGSSPQIAATYDYVGDDGKLLYQVCRMTPKDFRQRTPDGAGGWNWKLGDTRRVLYRLPKVLESAAAGRVVFVVEGEKDVHGIEKLGFVATTNAGGAGKGKWKREFSDALKGARVVVLPDNDEPGREHAAEVLASLEGKAKEAALLELPGLDEKGDVSDWISAGGSAEQLRKLALEALAANRPKPRSLDSIEAGRLCKADLERRMRGEIKGLSWPVEWPSLSSTLGPLEPGTLTVVSARPSAGKTIFAMQLQRHLCQRGHSVLYISLELPVVRLIRRHWCAYGAHMANLKGGAPSESDITAIARYERDSNPWRVHYDTTSKSVEHIRAEVEMLGGVECVIVDYLQRMVYDTSNEYALITSIANELQDLCRDLAVPVVCLSQLRRPLPGKEHVPPNESSTRGSGAVEERATTLILLHRKTEVQKDSDGQVIARNRSVDGVFIVAKNADGRADVTIPTVLKGAAMCIIERADS